MITFFRSIFNNGEQINTIDLASEASLSYEYSRLDRRLLSKYLQLDGKSPDDLRIFLKNSLSEDKRIAISLTDESSNLKKYCALFELFSDNDLIVNCDLCIENSNFFIPSFLLFPLVQNAFYYGYHAERKFPVRVKGKLLGDTVVFEVSNQVNHRMDDQRKTEVLKLYRSRLDFEYKDQYNLILNSNSKTFKATLHLKLRH